MSEPNDPNAVPRLERVRAALGAAVLACFETVRSGNPHLYELAELRDRASYRATSLDMHRRLLEQQVQTFTSERNRNYLALESHRAWLIGHRVVIVALFDDVLFNAMSFFDYLGNLAGYIYLGPNGAKLKWNGWIRSARDTTNTLSAHPIAMQMLNADRRWVGRLQEVRSEIIHFGAKAGEANITTRMDEARRRSELAFELPHPIARRLPFLTTVETPLLVNRAADRIVEETYSTGTAILQTIAEMPRLWS